MVSIKNLANNSKIYTSAGSWGVLKRGQGTCGTFQSCKQAYLHVLHTGMVYITLWYVHIPRYVLGQNLEVRASTKTGQIWQMEVPRSVLQVRVGTIELYIR